MKTLTVTIQLDDSRALAVAARRHEDDLIFSLLTLANACGVERPLVERKGSREITVADGCGHVWGRLEIS